MKKFVVKPEISYGKNGLDALKNLNSKKVLIVTDEFMVKFGLCEKIEKVLKEQNIDYFIFDKVLPNPSIEMVVKILKTYLSYEPDTVIAIGGGSPIDAAKGAIFFLTKMCSMFGGVMQAKKPYFVAIPTTSGTGSEVTSYSVITDEEKSQKIALADDVMLPDLAVLDPEFIKTLPKSVIADTGMDALTHAIEAYVSSESNSFTDALAMGSIENIFKYLIANYEDVKCEKYREEIQNASCMAGIAFNNSSLGINHSLAHAIGGKFHIAHGKINAILMPYVIEFNSGLYKVDNTDLSKLSKENLESLKRYAKISKVLGLPASTDLEGTRSLIVAINVLKKHMKIPKNLMEYGVVFEEYKKEINTLAKMALNDICTTGNKTKVNIEDLKLVLEKVY